MGQRRRIKVDSREVLIQEGDFGPTGPAVLFLSGLGHGADDWDHVRQLLPSRLCSFSMSRWGIGDSDPRPADSPPLTVGELSEEEYELAKSLGVTEAILVGHSQGGAEALHIAARHPEWVRGLVLVDPQMVPLDVACDERAFSHDRSIGKPYPKIEPDITGATLLDHDGGAREYDDLSATYTGPAVVLTRGDNTWDPGYEKVAKVWVAGHRVIAQHLGATHVRTPYEHRIHDATNYRAVRHTIDPTKYPDPLLRREDPREEHGHPWLVAAIILAVEHAARTGERLVLPHDVLTEAGATIAYERVDSGGTTAGGKGRLDLTGKLRHLWDVDAPPSRRRAGQHAAVGGPAIARVDRDAHPHHLLHGQAARIHRSRPVSGL